MAKRKVQFRKQRIATSGHTHKYLPVSLQIYDRAKGYYIEAGKEEKKTTLLRIYKKLFST